METQKEQLQNSDYKIIDWFVMNSSFDRIPNPKRRKDWTNKGESDISVEIDISEERVVVVLSTRYFQSEKEMVDGEEIDKVQVEIFVRIVGLFEVGDKPEIPVEEFGNMHAAAILYPIARERVSTLSLHGGLGRVILPIADFRKIYQEKKKIKSKETP